MSSATASPRRAFDATFLASFRRNAIEATKNGHADDHIICDHPFNNMPYWANGRIYMQLKKPIRGYKSFDDMFIKLYSVSQAHSMVIKHTIMDGYELTDSMFDDNNMDVEIRHYHIIMRLLNLLNEHNDDYKLIHLLHDNDRCSKLIRYHNIFRDTVNKWADEDKQVINGYNRPNKRAKALDSAACNLCKAMYHTKESIAYHLSRFLDCSIAEIPFMVQYNEGTGEPTHE